MSKDEKVEIRLRILGGTVKYKGYPEDKAADLLEVAVKMKVTEADIPSTFRDNFEEGSPESQYDDAKIIKMFQAAAAAIEKRRQLRASKSDEGAAAKAGGSGSEANGSQSNYSLNMSPASTVTRQHTDPMLSKDNSSYGAANGTTTANTVTVPHSTAVSAIDALGAIPDSQRSEMDEFIRRVLSSDAGALADTMIGTDPLAEGEMYESIINSPSRTNPSTSRTNASTSRERERSMTQPAASPLSPLSPSSPTTRAAAKRTVDFICQLGRDKDGAPSSLTTKLSLERDCPYDTFQRTITDSVGEDMRVFFLDSDDDEIDIDDEVILENFFTIARARPGSKVYCVPLKESAHGLNGGEADTVNIILKKELVGHTHVVFDCCALRGRDRLMTCSRDGTVKIWDTESGAIIKVIENAHKESVFAVAGNPANANMVATASADCTVKLWNISASTGTKICTLSGHSGKVHCIVFTPDGEHICSGGGDGTVRVWLTNYQFWKPMDRHIIEYKKGAIFAISLTHTDNGTTVAAAGESGKIMLANTKTGKVGITIRGHEKPVWGIDYSSDDKYLISCSMDSELRLWEASTGGHLLTFSGHTAPVHSAVFTPNGGKYIVSAGNDRTVRVWDRVSGKLAGCFEAHKRTIAKVVALGEFTFATASLDHLTKVFEFIPK